ncbi:MAG: hypothetical protein WDO06_02815 [Actinomycetota bacterium]
MPAYSKFPRIFPRTKVTYRAGKPIDLSPWYGKEEDQAALIEATALVMKTITTMLEEIRGAKAPEVPFDPRTSELPRTGNYKKAQKKKETNS